MCLFRSAEALIYFPGKNFLRSYVLLLPHTKLHWGFITKRPAQQKINISNAFLDLFYTTATKNIRNVTDFSNMKLHENLFSCLMDHSESGTELSSLRTRSTHGALGSRRPCGETLLRRETVGCPGQKESN